MKPNTPIDGGRQRCLECGHPRREHSNNECTVPKCACVAYAMPGVDSD